MASSYRPNALVADDGTIVALMHVESVSQCSKNEDAVVDKLKDDLTFVVTTVSGRMHTISVKRLVRAYRKECSFDTDMHDTYLAVLDRWIHLLGS
jgi:hypothetical protein